MLADRTAPARPVAIATLGAFALTLPAYLATMNRGIGFIDRGELAAVAATLGIAHPTGYPLFTLLGNVLARLAPGHVVLALNGAAAVLTAAGAAVLVPLYDEWLRRTDPGAAPAERAPFALLGALVTASGSVWWQQANGWEVYALHALLAPLALLAAARWLRTGGTAAAAFAGLALGLAFTNHLTTVLLVPALAILLLLDPRRGERVRELPAAVVAGVLALGTYAYLPLRTAQHPALDWGEPTTAARFVAHVGAREFRSWMFSDAAEFAGQARYVAIRLPADLAWAGAALALAGLAVAWRRDRRVALATLVLFGGCVLYACGYGIRDIDAYLLAAGIATGAWVACALLALRRRGARSAAIALAVALVAGNAWLHHGECDESRLNLPEDFARQQLAALPARAVLMDAQWDYTLSPSLALQAIEHVRPDVTVIGAHLLKHPWYVRALRRRDPALVAPAARECDAFLEAARPYEEGRTYDAAQVGRRWLAFVTALRERALASRPVCLTAGVGPELAGERPQVPLGLCWQLAVDTAYVAAPAPPSFRPWTEREDPWVASTSLLRARAALARADYEWRHGHAAAAAAWFGAARACDPHFDPARVPVLPLDGADLVRESATFFERLRSVHG